MSGKHNTGGKRQVYTSLSDLIKEMDKLAEECEEINSNSVKHKTEENISNSGELDPLYNNNELEQLAISNKTQTKANREVSIINEEFQKTNMKLEGDNSMEGDKETRVELEDQQLLATFRGSTFMIYDHVVIEGLKLFGCGNKLISERSIPKLGKKVKDNKTKKIVEEKQIFIEKLEITSDVDENNRIIEYVPDNNNNIENKVEENIDINNILEEKFERVQNETDDIDQVKGIHDQENPHLSSSAQNTVIKVQNITRNESGWKAGMDSKNLPKGKIYKNRVIYHKRNFSNVFSPEFVQNLHKVNSYY